MFSYCIACVLLKEVCVYGREIYLAVLVIMNGQFLKLNETELVIVLAICVFNLMIERCLTNLDHGTA